MKGPKAGKQAITKVTEASDSQRKKQSEEQRMHEGRGREREIVWCLSFMQSLTPVCILLNFREELDPSQGHTPLRLRPTSLPADRQTELVAGYENNTIRLNAHHVSLGVLKAERRLLPAVVRAECWTLGAD